MQTTLHNLRIKQNMTQSELAIKSGVNFRTLQDFEQGRKSLSNAKGEMIYRLSKALNCSVEYLLSDSVQDILIEANKSSEIYNRINEYEHKLNDIELYGKYYKFPVIIQNSNIQMERIYPLKQKLVSKIYDTCHDDLRISSIILFGSSITMQCHKDSDIDMSVQLNKEYINNDTKNDVSEKIQEVCNWNADILWFDRLSSEDRVYQDIRNGVKIV